MMASAFGVVLCLAACNHENDPADPEPSSEIKNQIEYNSESLVNIKSVIYEIDEHKDYSFYLSPSENIIDVDGMRKANDYAFVKVNSVKGKIDTKAEAFEVTYKDIAAKKEVMENFRKIDLYVNLLSKTSVEISADVITTERKPLFVRYNGGCAKALATLSNQIELNQETTTTVASSTAWRYNLEGISEYSLYAQSNVSNPADATPVLTIKISDDADFDDLTNLDLSAVSADELAISYGDMVLGAGRKGTLTMSTDDNETELTILMDATIGENRIRATYTGVPAMGYYSSDKLTIKSAAGTVENTLPVLFRQKDGENYVFAFGTNDKAAAAADLTAGDYAVKVTIPASAFDEDGEADADFTKVKAELYYYPAYATLTSEKAEGEVSIATVPGATDGKIYFYATAALASGETLTAEYYGVPVDGEIPDLTPVKPVEPKIVITDENGKELKKVELTAMEVCKVNYLRDIAGTFIDGNSYIFYFRDANTAAQVDNDSTPFFVLPEAQLGCEDLDIYKATGGDTGTGLLWTFKYNVSELSQSRLGYGYFLESYYAYRTPETASLTVKKDGKDWYFKFTMKDWGSFGMFAYGGKPAASGTKNTVTIEWSGKATKYSGRDYANEMKDEDY